MAKTTVAEYTRKMRRLQHSAKSDAGKKIEGVALTIQHLGFDSMAHEWRREPGQRQRIAEYWYNRLTAKHPALDVGRRFYDTMLDAIATHTETGAYAS